jgi:hypothetical protein
MGEIGPTCNEKKSSVLTQTDSFSSCLAGNTQDDEKGIIAAACAGNLEDVNLLLEAGAKVHAKNKVRKGGARALFCMLGRAHDMRRIGVRDRK